MRDLLFTRSETGALLDKAGVTLSGDAHAHLEGQVEGWPVGLRLLMLALRDTADPEAFVMELHGGHQHVQEYLFEEVVARHSPEMQEWLLNTSILDRFCPALCEAVCTEWSSPGSADFEGRRFVDRLHEGDLFVIPLDSRGDWVRCHHLFQGLLQGLLEQRHPERVAPLHARASAWFEGAGLLDEAIGHALEAGDTARAATLVAQAGPELLAREQCTGMERLLDRLPREAVGADPMLLILEAWTHHFRLRMPEWAASLQQIEQSLSGSAPPPPGAESLRACLDALRSSYFYWTSDLEQALACSARALEGIPPELHRLRVHATLVRACALQATGAHDDALSLLTSALAEDRVRAAGGQAPLLGGVCTVHWQSARLAEMLQAARRLARASGGSGVGTHQRWARIYQAMPLYQLNELARVEDLLRATAESPSESARGVVRRRGDGLRPHLPGPGPAGGGWPARRRPGGPRRGDRSRPPSPGRGRAASGAGRPSGPAGPCRALGQRVRGRAPRGAVWLLHPGADPGAGVGRKQHRREPPGRRRAPGADRGVRAGRPTSARSSFPHWPSRASSWPAVETRPRRSTRWPNRSQRPSPGAACASSSTSGTRWPSCSAGSPGSGATPPS